MSWLVDFAVSFCFLIVLMLFFGMVPSWQIVFVPLFLLLNIMFALAVGFWTASLAVKFRDVKFVVTYGLRAFMYLTPVAYSGTLIPAEWQWLYRLNPMYWVIEGFRWSILGTASEPSIEMIWPVLFTVCTLVVGMFLFRRTERTVVDLL
jgi:lipopolysaccharide transport system permease protein